MSNALEGKIIKGIGGFYYVDTAEGVIECRARGKFRHEGISPLVGDFVKIEAAYVVEILPRKNALIRPKVANVDQAIITFAAVKPKINLEILDRFLILTAEAGVRAMICINKIDLLKEQSLEELRQVYGRSGCEIIGVSAKEQLGIKCLQDRLQGVTSVFAGPSGVGKSSIINLLVPDLALKTGEISKKISRGKHTTREAVLVRVGRDGYVVDTPGFTSLDLSHIQPNKLAEYFHDFDEFIHDCKYNSCAHLNEQPEDCGIKRQVGAQIHPKRYACYCRIYEELQERQQQK